MSMGLQDVLKTTALRWLPDWLLFQVKKRHYVRVARLSSLDDEPDLRVVQALVSDGDFVVDVGANVGIYTIWLSHLVGARGQVLSFEPMATTHALLRHCVRKLKLENVELVQRAVSDTCGRVMMEVPLYPGGGGNFYQARIVSAKTAGLSLSEEVETVALDSILPGYLRPVSFVKCDVEGHELSSIRGAAAVITSFMPAWLIEVSGDPDDSTTNAATVFNLMTSNGYSALWFDGSKLKHRRTGDTRVKYFFLTDSQIERVKRHAIPVLGGGRS
jgi:FkbM family methyltransferase